MCFCYRFSRIMKTLPVTRQIVSAGTAFCIGLFIGARPTKIADAIEDITTFPESANVSAEVRRQVEVFSFVVPRTALSEAVKSKEAAAIEAQKFREAHVRKPFPDYSGVIFVKSNAGGVSPLFGTLRVWIPDRHDMEIGSISGSTYSVFVIDSGDTSTIFSGPAKAPEWLSLKVRL